MIGVRTLNLKNLSVEPILTIAFSSSLLMVYGDILIHANAKSLSWIASGVIWAPLIDFMMLGDDVPYLIAIITIRVNTHAKVTYRG